MYLHFTASVRQRTDCPAYIENAILIAGSACLVIALTTLKKYIARQRNAILIVYQQHV